MCCVIYIMAVSLLRILSKFQQTFTCYGAKSVCASRVRKYSIDQAKDTSSSDNPSNRPNGSHDEKGDDVRERILSASLPFVAAQGWTKNAIGAGAESIGYAGVAHGMFPHGGIELIQHFYVGCNRRLAEQLLREEEEAALDPTKKKESMAYIQGAVETRLRMIVPYLDKWPQAIGIMSLPPNVPTSLAHLLTLVDDICYYAGDRSVDFSWYTRRVALAGIYKVTELYLVQDKSADHEHTWQFLARRIEDAGHLHQYLQQSGEASQVAKEAVASAFITARNILGLNLGNR